MHVFSFIGSVKDEIMEMIWNYPEMKNTFPSFNPVSLC